MKKLHSLSLIKATLTIRRAKPTAAYLMVTILHFVVVLVVVLFDREQYAQGPCNSFVVGDLLLSHFYLQVYFRGKESEY